MDENAFLMWVERWPDTFVMSPVTSEETASWCTVASVHLDSDPVEKILGKHVARESEDNRKQGQADIPLLSTPARTKAEMLLNHLKPRIKLPSSYTLPHPISAQGRDGSRQGEGRLGLKPPSVPVSP